MNTSCVKNIQKLEELRQTIKILDSYQLPDHYSNYLGSVVNTNTANNEIIGGAQLLLEQTAQQQYNNAKQRYLRQRFEELFLQHVATYNGETFQFPTPSQTKQEEERMTQKRQELQEKLMAQVHNIVQKRNEVLLKYNILQERKEELKALVEDLVTKAESNDDEQEGEEEEDEEEEITESEIKEQQSQLDQLLAKKLELQAKLAAVKVETQHLETENLRLLEKYNSVSGDTPISKPTEDYDLDDIQSTTMRLQREIQEGEEKIRELQELVEWYDAMRSALNELSGIRVLNVSSVAATANEEGKSDALMILFQLLDEYTLQVELHPSTIKRSMTKLSQNFRVARATLKGELLVGEGFTQTRIPPLDDLVEICQQLPEHEDLRFILREAIARIRAVRCRVEELVNLRKNYAVTIENEGQKLYCSLNEGVTAVLRLSLDFPMVRISTCGISWRHVEDSLIPIIVMNSFLPCS